MVGRLMLLITYYIAAIVDGNVTGTDDIMYQRINSSQGPSLILTSCTQPLGLSGLVIDCSIKMFCSKCALY